MLLLLLSLSQAKAYELSWADNNVVTKLEERLFSVLDTKSKKVTLRLLEKIDMIQEKRTNERILAILEKLEIDIELRYKILKYALANSPTPVLYTKDFQTQFGGADWLTLNFDDYGEIDAIEMIAIPGTVIEVKEDLWNDIYKVSIDEYPVDNDLYVHSSFLSDLNRTKPDARLKSLASKEEILARLRSIEWKDYVWGGNAPEGIPELLDIFPPKSEISDLKKEQWKLTWVDCSGLLYWATDGNTPRNTSWLVEHGERLKIAGKTLQEIIPMLEPLDVIVWKGHMLIVLDEDHTIESAVWFTDKSLTPWVQIRKTTDSLWEVMKKRTAVNNYTDSDNSPFVIMRWYEG